MSLRRSVVEVAAADDRELRKEGAGEAVAEVMRMRETFKMTTKANDSLVVLTGNDQHGPLVELTTQEWIFFR